MKEVQFFQVTKQNISSSTITEIENLKTSLKKSEKEREALAEQLDRVTLNFQDACRELNLYKYENIWKYSHDTRLSKSRSYTEIGRATIDLNEHLRYENLRHHYLFVHKIMN